MQDGIACRDDAFRTEFASGWAKEGQHFGSPSPLILMRLEGWVSFWLPRCSWLRDSLVRSGFILIQLHDPRSLRLLTRQLDQSFFSTVLGSWTVTVSLLRTRSA